MPLALLIGGNILRYRKVYFSMINGNDYIFNMSCEANMVLPNV